ncbi:EXS family-domain-containing protein [Pisolithus croceorrhizus]|nr:EXS family-domain-containing protein [Pisolithus croceorrhizus]
MLSVAGSMMPPSPSLSQLLQQLSPAQRKFFKLLDADLERVESFFLEREKEAEERHDKLREQLDELVAHRQRIYDILPSSNSRVLSKKGCFIHHYERNSTDLRAAEKSSSVSGRSGCPTTVGKQTSESTKVTLDPREYQVAKKKLKKAVVEHYRGLEVLNNYRVLNLVGFRKALKKFEKVTKLPALTIYMSEKVEPSAFSSGARVGNMIKEMEDIYAARFARGDRRTAMKRLRLDSHMKSHYMSVFRSGAYLGLAVAALSAGIYQCTCPSLWKFIRVEHADRFSTTYERNSPFLECSFVHLRDIWYACLAGATGWREYQCMGSRAHKLSIYLWCVVTHSLDGRLLRFAELDLRTKMDPRQYFEIPSLVTCALAFAFWLSFSRFGPPMLWPLVWLAVVLVLLLNPLPRFMSRSSRWWTIRNLAKLFLSGAFPVDFTSFWFGDQMCSLTFTLENLYFFSCVYANYFPKISGGGDTVSSPAYDPRIQEAWVTCPTSRNWGIHYCIAILPYLMRLVQCVRRYRDTRFLGNLLNAGKYGSGMVSLLCYHYWVYSGTPRQGSSFVFFCFTESLSSLYACAWVIELPCSRMVAHCCCRLGLDRGLVLVQESHPLSPAQTRSNLHISNSVILFCDNY